MKKHLNHHLFTIVFGLGLIAVAWVAVGFIGSHFLALVMTVVIAAVYGFGALELRQFRLASATLSKALAAIPEPLVNLNDWLGGVHASLQNPVRLRIEGERVGLPGPALTPYLVGLLVMLGMLGTFLGMVVTLNGAVFALEGTTDLQAIRAALAAPIKGLGLAFGTSVAGVAASAMLGLMSALSRRDRLQASQLLDQKIATALRGFSLTHQRQETFKALQSQSQAMPEVITQMQAMMQQMERMSQQLNERLLTNQEDFHRNIKGVYTNLATSVDQSLRSSLNQSALMASEGIKPVVETAMAGMAQETRQMHERMVQAAQTQLDGLSARLTASTTAMADTWSAALSRHEQAYSSLQTEQAAREQQRLQAWTQSLQTMASSLQSEWQHTSTQTLSQQQRICDSMDQLATLLRTEFGKLRDDEALRGNAAVGRLGELQTALAAHLTTLGTALEDPIARLIQTASEAPRAAAEVIGQLRQEISGSIARDNELLQERTRIMETLNSLLASISNASVEQRAVIDSLVASSAVALNAAGNEFSEKAGAQATKLSHIAAHVSSSAVEVSSLSESFGFAVRSFNDANEKLIANLQRIEAAMDKSMARSDDQLAYYVAQAREIIDLSISSQKDIFDELRQLPAQQARLTSEVQ